MRILKKRGEAARAAEPAVVSRVPIRSKLNKRKLYLIFTLLALTVVLASAIIIKTASDRKDYKQYMDSAYASYQSHDYDSALAALRKAAAIDETEDCILMISDCYRAQGKLERALEVLRSANTRKKEIAAKISEFEQERAKLEDEGKISVAGKLFGIDTAVLKLDDMGLTDNVLSEIKQMYALDVLSLAGNKLRNISALSELGGISDLDLSRNRIEDVSPLKGLTSLRTLRLDGNPIKDLTPLCEITSLTSLSITGIQVDKETVEQLSSALPSCAIHTDTTDEQATEQQATDISFGGVTFKSDVTELSLSGMGIRDISTLSVCTQLRVLDLSGNEISDLSPLMNIPTLERLDVSDNRLTNLRTLMGINGLWFLNAAGNSISDTSPFSMMGSIKELYLDQNPIHDFSGLRKLENLEKLGIAETGITDADLEYLYELKHLTTLNICDNEELSGEAIDILRQKISPCNIQHSELVYTVDFGGRQFKSNATELDLSGAGLADIGEIQSMTELERAELSKNQITNIYPLEFSNSRFSIKHLDLSDNSIVDISAVACLQSIETIDLSNNQIEAIRPLMNLSTLKQLDLSGNRIPAEEIAELRRALPECEIISDYEQ